MKKSEDRKRHRGTNKNQLQSSGAIYHTNKNSSSNRPLGLLEENRSKKSENKIQNPIGKIISINISKKKGEKKIPQEIAELKENFGILGDAHAQENSNRQISLLLVESIKKMQNLGLKVKAGDFAENLTVADLDFKKIKVGTKIIIGKNVELEVSQIGKVCHEKCAIYYQAGDCVMPKEGIFARVVKGGKIKKGDVVVS